MIEMYIAVAYYLTYIFGTVSLVVVLSQIGLKVYRWIDDYETNREIALPEFIRKKLQIEYENDFFMCWVGLTITSMVAVWLWPLTLIALTISGIAHLLRFVVRLNKKVDKIKQ